MATIRTGFLALSLLALTGCASQSDMQDLQRDVDELKTRLFQVDKDMAGVKESARSEVEKSLNENQKDIESLRKNTADVQAAIDSAKVDMQVLAGKVDDLSNATKKPSEDIALIREDMENRFSKIGERLSQVEKNVADLQNKITEVKQEAETPESLYQNALDTFKKGDADKARDLFSKFIDKYPNNDMVANAHYWLGETYYTEKKYDQAILEFQQVIKNFPNKDKVPAAMLKQAMAFNQLGDNKSARYILEKLREDFPDSDEAKLAKDQLKMLK